MSNKDTVTPPETEVRLPKKRRTYTDAYKRRILEQLDTCVHLGERGAFLRREGIYHSTITRWRRQMARDAKTPRGRPPKTDLERENEQLRQEIDHIKAQLLTAHTVIDIQKKLCSLLENLPRPNDSENSK